MRNIKKLLSLTYLFLVLFSFPVSAMADTDSEKFHFQLDVSAVDELLPGDVRDQIILVKNNTDKRLAYMVEAVTFTGSEALAKELELCILDEENAFLYGTVEELSRRRCFETILRHPAGQEKALTLRFHLRKEAVNTVAGDTLTLSLKFFGTDAPLQDSVSPEETEKPSETPEPEESSKPEESKKPQESPGAGIKDEENASSGRPSGGSQRSSGRHDGSRVITKGYDETTPRFRAENPSDAGKNQIREWSKYVRRSEMKGKEEKSTTNEGEQARLAIRIQDVSPKNVSVQISTGNKGDASRDPMTLYIGPTRREKGLVISFLCLFIFLLILIICKCWLLYRAAQSENQEDRAYVSKEQGA